MPKEHENTISLIIIFLIMLMFILIPSISLKQIYLIHFYQFLRYQFFWGVLPIFLFIMLSKIFKKSLNSNKEFKSIFITLYAVLPIGPIISKFIEGLSSQTSWYNWLYIFTIISLLLLYLIGGKVILNIKKTNS